MKSKKGMLKAINSFAVFFILVAFVITCSLMLFVTTLADTLGVELTDKNVEAAAKMTFLNVVFITLLLTVIDTVRRKITVDRPVRQITEAAAKMINGDFSVRIPHVSRVIADDKFNEIIDCINTMARELSGVETLRTDFIANVSHELKTPLAVMQNYGTLLQSENLSKEERTEYAKAITDASRRLASMITNILKLNRLENQQIFAKSESYNLSEQLCTCLLQFEHIWESKGIEISTDIAENVTVNADPELLCLVWNNLFSNAFKFTEPGGHVAVSLAIDAEYATVTVLDTGCGMDEETGAHIFEKFYQGDTSHATSGNGLGLALVKRVVDIMHGEIEVESELGRGSTFTVKIGRTNGGEVRENI